MTYRVRLIDDDQLPPEHSWALVREAEGDCILFVKPTILSAREVEHRIEAVERMDCSTPA